MKRRLLTILISLVLVSVAAEMIYGMRQVPSFSVAVMEKEEKGKTEDGAFEKEDAKVKAIQQPSGWQEGANTQSVFTLSNIYFTCSVYLSLPEIPPKTA